MTEASPTPTNDPSQKSSPTSDLHSTQLDQGGWDSLPGESEAEVDYTPEQTGRVEPEEAHPRYPQPLPSSYVPVPTLSVNVNVVTPDGRSFSFEEAVEYEDDETFEFGDIAPLFERVVETANFRFDQ